MTVPRTRWDGENAEVAIASVPPSYDAERDAASETPIGAALDQLSRALGWSDSNGTPLSALVRPGDKVVVKPNWVLHANANPAEGFDPLVTHGSVIRSVVEALRQTPAQQIVIGDAPVQSCDFPTLIANSGLTAYFAATREADSRVVAPVDFRRTVSSIQGAVRTAEASARGLDEYVLFDLGGDSYLDPITTSDTEFRVTQYPPDLMRRTHTAGRHQYLVAREIIDANVIVNMPKLKTHKKAGVTCALKNLVGINGNKEFLPHHRVGGPGGGGDCYPENSIVKRMLEEVLDAQNVGSSRVDLQACKLEYSIVSPK